LLAAFAQVRSDMAHAVASPMPRASATAPHVNSVGLAFVPIPRFKTLVGTHPVRVQDYQLYCTAKNITFPDQKNPTDLTHPVVNVSWQEAIDYCLWLTSKERDEGIMPKDQFYRMLYDLEWSSAIGLPNEGEDTPAERSKAIKIAIQTTRQTNAVLKYANAYSDMLLSLLEGTNMYAGTRTQ
jgi:hypothetical protein